MNEITRHIDNLRSARGWSVYKLAHESGLNEQTIYNWASKKSYPAITALKAICDAFGITMADFFAKGNMVEVKPEVKKLYEDWCLLTPTEKDSILAIMKNYLDSKQST